MPSSTQRMWVRHNKFICVSPRKILSFVPTYHIFGVHCLNSTDATYSLIHNLLETQLSHHACMLAK